MTLLENKSFQLFKYSCLSLALSGSLRIGWLYPMKLFYYEGVTLESRLRQSKSCMVRMSLSLWPTNNEVPLSLIGNILRWGFLIWELFFLSYCGLFVLILVVFCVVSSSLRFCQVSPLAFFRWLTVTSDRNAKSCNRIPVITAFHSCCLSHHVFWPIKPLVAVNHTKKARDEILAET